MPDDDTDHSQVIAVNQAMARGELKIFSDCETTLLGLLGGMDTQARSNLG
jgi:hypothetical protein